LSTLLLSCWIFKKVFCRFFASIYLLNLELPEVLESLMRKSATSVVGYVTLEVICTFYLGRYVGRCNYWTE
jgi:hypothetical protein